MSPNSFLSALKTPPLSRLFGQGPDEAAEAEYPLRAELFALSQLESHGRLLASDQQIDPTPGPEVLLERLKENERVIRESYDMVAQAVRKGRQTAPGADWLLDNYYLIEEQIDIAREHLPPGYSRQLPRLAAGPLKGFPRVYELALELVSHTDGRIDMENLSRFVRGVQTVRALALGELWAVPIMLRLALLENLRRVSYRVAARRRDRDRALVWARRFLEVVHTQPKALITELADFVRASPRMSQAFIAELCTGLQGQHPALSLVNSWIEQDLAEHGQTMDQILRAESHDQAADRVSIANSITSLRTLTALDWHEFVEDLSETEAALRRDPSGVYATMDFATRDKYRHVVEELARWSRRPEHEVAVEAVRLAEERAADPEAVPRHRHVGWFLVRPGRIELEHALGCRPPIHRRLGRWIRRWIPWVYVLSEAVVTAVVTGVLLLLTKSLIVYGWSWLVPAAVALLVFVSQSVISLINWLATVLVPVRSLPRLDFSKGIPREHTAVVVVPTLLASPAGADSLVEGLEIRYLANRSPNLLFALLTDFTDAPRETMPGDEELVRRVAAGIRDLNARYAEPGQPIFFLLHRPRQWNPAEGVWMGYERKRGKLMAFNQVLRGGPTEAYTSIVGNVEVLRTARYVIPLDTDTQLPPETAVRMVGSMAHPLNRPVLDPTTGCVDEGYGVLQPRVAIGLAGAGRSLFARLFAGEVGIDPYTREVSNVYHDLFGRGQFIGKGIYHLEAFDKAVHNRFPENRILSHDLIEGCHAQCGFLNDVELIEDHPSRYLADVKRRHRWVRGDWQIAPWLLPRVPAPDGRRVPNPLPRLPRWMIFDNLRRSLVPPIMLVLLIGGWLALEGVQPAWTLWLLAVYFVPDVVRTAWAFLSKPSKVLWAAHVRRAALGAGRQFLISALHLAFLPFEAIMHVDAIARVFWRTLVSRRHLLEWLTAHHVERATQTGLVPTLREMWTAPTIALLTVALMLALEVAVPAVAWPILGLWVVGPLLAWFLSRPARVRRVEFSADQERFLRRLSRRTWTYFEHFVGPNQNWLPPDNFQEQPQNRVIERTSPTNVGLALLSNLAAYDFGYLTVGALIERTEKTFATLERLPRYRNHFLNWYDTWTLEPLRPQYVSTVDSGNLACCLVALRGGLQELMAGPVLPARWREGLEDVADVFEEEARNALDRMADPHVKENVRKVSKTVKDGLQSLSEADASPAPLLAALRRFAAELTDVAPLCQHDGNMTFWMAAMRRQVDGLLADLVYMMPWLADGQGNPHPTVAEPSMPRADAALLLHEELERLDSLRHLAELDRRLGAHLDDLLGREEGVETPEAERLRHLRAAVAEASERAAGRIRALEDLALQCGELSEVELDFLYDPARKLLSIGFSLEGRHRDPGYYDLFASESRLCSYLGVAQGRLPLEHWFLLGRLLTPGLEMPTLMSWSGSMFEYLMPLLVMPNYEGTLLDQACHNAVLRQIKHGRRQRVPWGFSESCYNQVDVQMNYQYRAFGVPELGLKRGLANDLVVAPYAATMALMVLPEKACAALQTLDRLGLMGRFGFYEAIDYTPTRVPADQDYAIVRCFMAHHGGMSFLSLAYALLGQPMQRRFMSDPRMRANALLLQERIPAARSSTRQDHRQVPLIQREQGEAVREATVRAYADPNSPIPGVHLLSNGRYHVMVTSAGSGFSRWHDLALTRWREDVTRDNWGFFFYLHDLDDGYTWSCTHQPLAREVERYEAVFSQARAEFRTVHHQVDAHVQISVSPEDDVELRRITLTNLSNTTRSIELTSFAEVALAEPAVDLAHPVFNSLFVQTETIPEKSAILCTRRPRSGEESPPWMFHAMIVHADRIMPWASFETDRARFLGRGRSAADPAALDHPGPLSNTAGSVLDPNVSVRRRLRLDPGEVVTVDAIAGMGTSRDEAVALVERYHDRRLADRLFELAWTQSQVLLHQLHATETDALLFARLAASIVFANSRYRANASLLARNRKGQADLWRYGISGDLPIVLVRVTDQSGLELVRRIIQAHGYWRHKGLRVDLVIWVDAFAGYRQSLWDQIMGVVNAGPMVSALDQRGGVFVRSSDQLPEDDRMMLQ